MSAAPLAIGEPAPGFELLDTDGTPHAPPAPGEAPATVVVWTCNHCPYALAWHGRLLDVAAETEPSGVRFLFVNSNDAERYPADSPEAMRERHRAEAWPIPYLHDPDQSVARAWGAETTPHVFVLDSERRLAYRGAPDGDHQRPELRAEWLRDALEAVLAGAEPRRPETEPVGCAIKWRP